MLYIFLASIYPHNFLQIVIATANFSPLDPTTWRKWWKKDWITISA
jgi:hypothetical protein